MVEELLICPECGHENPPEAHFCQNDGVPLRSTDPDDPLMGRLVGNYRLLERKGEGGFGVVYRAEHREMGTQFAVKILHPQFSANRQATERFRREAIAAGRIRHEHVVHVADFGNAKGIGHYYAMEYLEGRTLKALLEQEKSLPIHRILHIARQICSAMENIHAKQIIHRDLKPENIFLTTKEQVGDFVKLVDFGIAKMLDDAGAVSITKTGLSVGTPLYMSPEQARGKLRNLDHRSDIYSWGVILFELLTGQPPFFSENPHEVVMLHVRGIPPRLSDINPIRQFSPELEALFRRMLAKKPEERPDSMLETYRLLEPLLLAPDGVIDEKASEADLHALATGLLDQESSDVQTPIYNHAPKALLKTSVATNIVSSTSDQLQPLTDDLLPSDPEQENAALAKNWREGLKERSAPLQQDSHPDTPVPGSPELEQAQSSMSLDDITFDAEPTDPRAMPPQHPTQPDPDALSETGTSETTQNSPAPVSPSAMPLLVDEPVSTPTPAVQEVRQLLSVQAQSPMQIAAELDLLGHEDITRRIQSSSLDGPSTQKTPALSDFSTNATAFHSPAKRLAIFGGIAVFVALLAVLLYPRKKVKPLSGPSAEEIYKLQKQQAKLRAEARAARLARIRAAKQRARQRALAAKQKPQALPTVREVHHDPLVKQLPIETRQRPAPPMVRANLNSTTSSSPNAKPAILLIRSRPSAGCYIGRRRLGSTPCTIKASEGQRLRIWLRRRGYRSRLYRWNAKGETESPVFVLRRRPARRRKPPKRRTQGGGIFNDQGLFKTP